MILKNMLRIIEPIIITLYDCVYDVKTYYFIKSGNDG